MWPVKIRTGVAMHCITSCTMVNAMHSHGLTFVLYKILAIMLFV